MASKSISYAEFCVVFQVEICLERKSKIPHTKIILIAWETSTKNGKFQVTRNKAVLHKNVYHTILQVS